MLGVYHTNVVHYILGKEWMVPYIDCKIVSRAPRSRCTVKYSALEPNESRIVINRWIDELEAPDRGMNGSLPLPNQNKNKVNEIGPWIHRLLVLSTFMITILFQEQIIELLGLVNIVNNVFLVIVQLIIIIISWGVFHKILRLS